jgi:hypothetical protein
LFGWDLLPHEYINNPMFVRDEECLPGRIQPSQQHDSNAPTCHNAAESTDVMCSDISNNGSDIEMLTLARIPYASNATEVTHVPFNDASVICSDIYNSQEIKDYRQNVSTLSATDIIRLQTRVRQLLATLSSHTYNINNCDILEAMVKDLTTLHSTCKQHVQKTTPDMYNTRKRIAKKYSSSNNLLSRIKARRSRQRLRRLLKKQQRMLQCNFYSVSLLYFLTQYFCTCYTVCNFS